MLTSNQPHSKSHSYRKKSKKYKKGLKKMKTLNNLKTDSHPQNKKRKEISKWEIIRI